MDQPEGVRRIWISKELNAKLEVILKRVNDGFDGGKISRAQIVTWQLMRWAETCGDRDIEMIRLANINEVTMLEAIIRKAKESGEMPQCGDSELFVLICAKIRLIYFTMF